MSGSSLLEVPQQVALALTLASNATGADFDYLLKTAARESSFRPAAASRSSSARGLFQFINSTWLRTLKEQGAKYGLHELASKIERRQSGRYHVPDRAERRRILKLRDNPTIAALMAGAFTRSNAEIMIERLGREPSGGELYLAHFLGASDAVRMINLARTNPHWRADKAFPRAARANRTIFYDVRGNGRARSVRQVYRRLVRVHTRGIKTSSQNWATHIVKVKPEVLQLRRSKPIPGGAPLKRVVAAVEKKSVPLPRRVVRMTLPVRKTAPTLVADAASTALTLASVAEPITSLLRGALHMPKDTNSQRRRLMLSLADSSSDQ
ncbi:MAG: transglycosylase SLT domain-containing protein [Pseudomonadota bacterium]